MQKLFRLVIAGLALTVLAGCQTLPGSAMHHYSNEVSPAFYRHQYELYESDGREFRGYRPLRRHWFVGGAR